MLIVYHPPPERALGHSEAIEVTEAVTSEAAFRVLSPRWRPVYCHRSGRAWRCMGEFEHPNDPLTPTFWRRVRVFLRVHGDTYDPIKRTWTGWRTTPRVPEWRNR